MIFLMDCFIVIVSGLLVYWLFNQTIGLIENFWKVVNTLMLFLVLSLVGFRLFHTYTGIMRYASFVDLMRVVYSNVLSLVLVLVADFGMRYLPMDAFVQFNTTSIFLIYIMATLMMWVVRVVAKTIYDVTTSDKRALRVLIYGAVSDGVGLAKNINTLRPRRFILKGFISNDVKLGKLGPNIGTEDWVKKKNRMQKMSEYGNKVIYEGKGCKNKVSESADERHRRLQEYKALNGKWNIINEYSKSLLLNKDKNNNEQFKRNVNDKLLEEERLIDKQFELDIRDNEEEERMLQQQNNILYQQRLNKMKNLLFK